MKCHKQGVNTGAVISWGHVPQKVRVSKMQSIAKAIQTTKFIKQTNHRKVTLIITGSFQYKAVKTFQSYTYTEDETVLTVSSSECMQTWT